MNKDNQILVTGGTGFIGSYLLRYLIREGYRRVRATRRKDSQLDLVAPVADQIEWFEGDILDVTFLEEAMRGVELVYHCAAIISFDPREAGLMMQVNVEGTANMVNAALNEGVRKLIHVSSVAAIGRSKDGETLTEKRIWQRSRFNTNYAISKVLGEQEAWRGLAEGLPVNIVNPSIVIGGGRWEEGPLQFFGLAWNNFPFYTPGASGFVDVRDVARFMVRLMDSSITGQRYILSAENMQYKTLMEKIAHYLNRRPPRYRLRRWMQQLYRWAAWLPARFGGYSPPVTLETVQLASSSFFFDNAKSIDQLNFNYLPFEETLASTCREFKEASTDNFSPRILPLIDA